ncbi:MAG: hypothetical protein HQ512_07730 [Rhodospirillales bacterium]|nr:hypothetical protein [Rhodospirillales bacterium]
MMMGAGAGDPSFLGDLIAAGIGGSNLHHCLDAGALASAPSGGQKWDDLTANAINFDAGFDETSETQDPPLNGTPGGLSATEYWSLDGADHFTKDSVNDAFLNALHHNNSKFAWADWVYVPASFPDTMLWSTGNAPSGREGAYSGFSGTSKQAIEIHSASATAFNKFGDTAIKVNAWNFCAAALDEAGGAVSFMYLGNADGNGYNPASAANTWDGAFTSPGTLDGSILQLGTRRNMDQELPATSRMGFHAMWNGGTLPTKTQFDTFYNSSKTRWGL